MKKSYLSAGKKSMLFCIGMGLVTALSISAVLTIGLTSLIQNGKLNENGMAGVFIIRVIATLAGGLLAAGLSDKKFLPVIGAVSAGYLVFLLGIGIVWFDGSFHKLWQGILSVGIGTAIACLTRLKPQRTRRKVFRYAK